MVEAGERRVDGRLVGWLSLVGVLAALNYIGRYGADTSPSETRDLLFRWTTFVAALLQFGLMLGLVLLIVRGRARELLALRRPRSWGRAIGIAALVLFGVLVITTIVGASGLDPSEEQGLAPDEFDSSRVAPFAANALLTALFAPLVEELLFRGAGFSLLSRFGRRAAVAGTAVLFGVGHGLVLGLLILVPIGLGLAWLRASSGSVYPSVALHSFYNAVVLTLAVTLGDRVS
jgi:hypothetical protein